MQITFEPTITAINADEWHSLWQTDYPFIQHAFLAALEQSGSVGDGTGWQPCHLIVRNAGQLMAAMPLYRKTHSYGEYVFDWSWANAYTEHQLPYYPKLVNAIPFTPATGPRVAYRNQEAHQAIYNAISQQLAAGKASGFHSLFPNIPSVKNAPPLLQRLGCQFHWFNHNYADFNHFLADFSSRKRKNLNKERQKIPAQNIAVTVTEGDQLTTEDWQGFYYLYQQTYLKRSGHNGYLTGGFFKAIGQHLKTHTLLVRAYQNNALIAGALYFYDSQILYGRYWGAIEEYDGLHFECCYYQGIQIAIQKKLKRFDPGAQGEHKIQRGFVPVLTQSYHQIAHPNFSHAIAQFLEEEKAHNYQYCNKSREYLPFKEGMPNPSPTILINPEDLT